MSQSLILFTFFFGLVLRTSLHQLSSSYIRIRLITSTFHIRTSHKFLTWQGYIQSPFSSMALSRSNQMIPELEAPGWLTRLTEAADKAYGNTMDILRAQQRDRRQILRKDNELKESRELNRKLETELVKCHEQIFRSIDTSNVSDASILDGLTSLQAGLSNWIETLPDSQQFSQNWTELHNFLEDNGFVTIDIDSKPEVIGRAEPELLIAVTFGILWTILFKPGPLGVSPDICSFLDTIQTNMSLVESKKGMLTYSLKGYAASFIPRHHNQTEQQSTPGDRICSEPGPNRRNMQESLRVNAERPVT